jgi:hypothetical protein
LIGFLEGTQAAVMSHAELERRVGLDGREVLRLALQGHFDRRAQREQRSDDICDAEGVPRRSVEAGHERMLATMFGEVIVERFAYASVAVRTRIPRTARSTCRSSVTPLLPERNPT